MSTRRANSPEHKAKDLLLDRDVGEQGAAALALTSDLDWGSCPIFAEVAGFFSELLDEAMHDLLAIHLRLQGDGAVAVNRECAHPQ